jgi:DNA-directed RNA polymerase subunit M/transcription elongation factor TFIIS
MVYIIENPEKFRSNVLNKLKENFGTINDENETFFINLEKGIYNYAIKEATFRKIVKKWENRAFVQLYTDRFRSIFINLKNPYFMNLIQTCPPSELTSMSHQDMNPDRWKQLIEQKKKRDESKYDTKVESQTDEFICRKCKSKRSTYYQLQTRSADEPMTIYCKCEECNCTFVK